MKQILHVRTLFRGTLLPILINLGLLANLVTPGPVVAAACPPGSYCAYLPGITTPAQADLVITGVEISQAVQDTNNTVPLVAGRSTTLRIYAITSNHAEPLSNIKVAVTANNSQNISLNESPLALSSTIPLAANRADYTSTINFQLPASWLSGTVDLTVKLDPDNAVRENNEANNLLTRRLVFNSVPPLKIKIVPIQYTNTVNGRTYAAPTRDTVSDWILRTYPINQLEITWHAPFAFSGNLTTSTDFNRLLSEVTALKSSERAPESQIYYGLIPTSSGGSTWFSSGYAGLGWIGARTAIGLELAGKTSQIAAHEVGHNLGMLHTPCGLSSGTDASYPYANASIGQYGLDVSAGRLYAPGANKDFMSYCDPKWVSDYTYKYLYTSQVRSGSAALEMESSSPAGLSQSGLMVRAQIGAEGAVLLPSYTLAGSVSSLPEAGDYSVQMLGIQDEVLADILVQAFATGDADDAQAKSIHALLPLPEQPAAKIRLLKDGQVLAEQRLGSMSLLNANHAVSAERDGKTVKLRWSSNQRPAVVRYSTDAGQTWTTLAVDFAGSELDLDAGTLPADAVIEIVEASE